MLIRFTVSNFMSFKEETEFNMLPAKGNGSRQLTEHIKKTKSGVEILKTAAIYGANASGKSNLVNAIDYFKKIVFNEEPSLIPNSKKFRIDSTYKSKPTTFRIEYEYKGVHFDYAIEVFKGKIKEEWLYQIKSVKKETEELLYKRVENKVEFGKPFKNSKDLTYIQKYLKKELQEDESVLDACFGVIDDIKILDTIYLALTKLTIVKPYSKSYAYSESILTGNKSTIFAKELLNSSKTGIEDLVVIEIDSDVFFSYSDDDFKKDLIDELETALGNRKENDKRDFVITFQFNSQINVLKKKQDKYVVSILKTKHFNSSDLFDFDEESDGTNRLFELSPAFEQLIHEGDVVYIIDELERNMHPLLAKELLKLYSLNSTSSSSQLIFTTHESHLLDENLLRRDEIWFTEKKEDGSTEFYPLSNFNPRGDKVLERGYLEGRYGGIPFLGNFKKLVEKLEIHE